MNDSIYLDNHATTPTDPRVREVMLPMLMPRGVGNPHSEHFAGRKAAIAVEHARQQVADLIGAQPEEIIFTSGATEANNIALQGIARASLYRGNHIITIATDLAPGLSPFIPRIHSGSGPLGTVLQTRSG